jgi:hypothetical protein
VENPEKKRQLERSSCRWEDNIKMDFQGVVSGGVEWVDMVWIGICVGIL